MSTNNKENLIQIPESIENLMQDYYKETENEQKITDAIDKLKNFKIESKDSANNTETLKNLIDTLSENLSSLLSNSYITTVGILDDGVNFVSSVLNLDEQYKIGVNKKDIMLVLYSSSVSLWHNIEYEYHDWAKVINLNFKLLDRVNADTIEILFYSFIIFDRVANKKPEMQLLDAEKIFGYAEKAMEFNIDAIYILNILEALLSVVNQCDLKGLGFNYIVKYVSNLIDRTGKAYTVGALNYMCQILISAIKKCSNDPNIDTMINDETLGLIKKIFGKVVIQNSGDIDPLIEMSYVVNEITQQYLENGGKNFELFKKYMGLEYNNNDAKWYLSDNNRFKEFVGNDIYRILKSRIAGISDDRIRIYEEIYLYVNKNNDNDLAQELENCFCNLKSVIAEEDCVLSPRDINNIVGLIGTVLDKVIAKDDIALGENTVDAMFTVLSDAVVNIYEKTDLITELDDAGKVLDCLDKVFENGNKITLNTTVFEVMFASLYNVVLNISENITLELVEKIYAALKKLNQKLDSEQIIPSNCLVDLVSRICANFALKNFELNKDNADNIWNLMNKFLNTEGVTLDLDTADRMLITLKYMLINKQNPSKISLDDSLKVTSQIFGKISTNELGEEKDNAINEVLEIFDVIVQELFKNENDQEKIKKTTGLIVKDGKILICNRAAVGNFFGQNMCSYVFNRFQQENKEIDSICEQAENISKQIQSNRFGEEENNQSLKKIVDGLNDYIVIRQNKLQKNHIEIIMSFINTVLNETENQNSKVNFSSDMLSSIFRIWGCMVLNNKDCVTTKQDIDNIIKWANNILSLEEQKKIELNSKIINSIVAILYLVEERCKDIDCVTGIMGWLDNVLKKHQGMLVQLVKNTTHVLYLCIATLGFELKDIELAKKIIGIIEQFTRLRYNKVEENQENNGLFPIDTATEMLTVLRLASSQKIIGDSPKAVLDTIKQILHNTGGFIGNYSIKHELLCLLVRLWKVGNYRETIKQVTGFVADAPYKNNSERIENKEAFKQFAGDKVYQIFFPEQQEEKQNENKFDAGDNDTSRNEDELKSVKNVKVAADEENYDNKAENSSNGNSKKDKDVSQNGDKINKTIQQGVPVTKNSEINPKMVLDSGKQEITNNKDLHDNGLNLNGNKNIGNQRENFANDRKENRELDKDFMERKSVDNPNLSEENKTEKSEEKPQGDLEPLAVMKLNLSELERKLNKSANVVQKPKELLNTLKKILKDTLKNMTDKNASEKRIIDKGVFNRITKILDHICGTLEKIDTENTSDIIENIYDCIVNKLVQKQSLDVDLFLKFLSISNKLGKAFNLQDFMSSCETQILLSEKSKEDLKKILKFIPESNMELQNISHISNFLTDNIGKIVVPQGNKGNALVKPTEFCGMLTECEVFGYCFKYYLMYGDIENLDNDNNDNVVESWVSDISNAIKKACFVDSLDKDQTSQIKKQILGELNKAAKAEDVIKFVQNNKDKDNDTERLEELGKIQKLSEQELLKLDLEQEQKKEEENEKKDNTGNDEVNKNNDKNKTENNVPIIDNINNLNQKENTNKENENEDNTGNNKNNKNNDKNEIKKNNSNEQTQEITSNANTSNRNKNENETKKNEVIKEEEGTNNIKIEEKSGSNEHKDNNSKSSVGNDDDDIEKNKEKNKLVQIGSKIDLEQKSKQTEQEQLNGFTPKPAGIYTTLAAISIFVPPVFGIGLFVLKFKNPEYKITGKDVILLFIYSLPIVAPIAGFIMDYKASQESHEMEVKSLANESSKDNDKEAIDDKINNINQNQTENIKTNEKNKTKTHNEKV